MLELVIFKYIDGSGRMVVALDAYPPREMCGKTGWHVFSSSCSVPLLRLKSSQQLLINWFVQDGLHVAGHLRKHQAYHAMLFESVDGDAPLAPKTQEHLEWTLGMRCIAHIGQSVVKATVSPWMTKECSDDAHMV